MYAMSKCVCAMDKGECMDMDRVGVWMREVQVQQRELSHLKVCVCVKGVRGEGGYE